jgi:hypothetical protein
LIFANEFRLFKHFHFHFHFRFQRFCWLLHPNLFNKSSKERIKRLKFKCVNMFKIVIGEVREMELRSDKPG